MLRKENCCLSCRLTVGAALAEGGAGAGGARWTSIQHPPWADHRHLFPQQGRSSLHPRASSRPLPIDANSQSGLSFFFQHQHGRRQKQRCPRDSPISLSKQRHAREPFETTGRCAAKAVAGPLKQPQQQTRQTGNPIGTAARLSACCSVLQQSAQQLPLGGPPARANREPCLRGQRGAREAGVESAHHSSAHPKRGSNAPVAISAHVLWPPPPAQSTAPTL